MPCNKKLRFDDRVFNEVRKRCPLCFRSTLKEKLKENVIVGRLIPAGTGSVVNRLKRVAGDRDRLLAPLRGAATPELVDATELRLPAAE